MPMSGADAPVKVEIYGATYTIRSEATEGDLVAAARQVDEAMREVALATGLSDSLKVAVLAALHIADDLNAARREMEALGKAATSCNALVDELLAPGEAPGPTGSSSGR